MDMISFIIPLHNHLAQTQAMLASLYSSIPSTVAYEIIFVDDASTDGTANWLRSLTDPRLKFSLHALNRGYAATNNAGVFMAKGDVLALLNNDLVLSPGWLEPMLNALNLPLFNIGLVGNVQYRLADSAIDHAGIAVSPRGQMQHAQRVDKAPLLNVFAVTGACMLMRKADYLSVGGFDEAYLNGCEDIDLCLKLRAAKKKICVASESRIHHYVSLSREVNTSRDLRNSRLLYSRWRREIKQELSRVWRALLADGPAAYAAYWSEPIPPELLATPWALSRSIAEAMLTREEAQWASVLNTTS